MIPRAAKIACVECDLKVRPVTLELPAGVARLVPLAEEHAAELLAACVPAVWAYLPERAPSRVEEVADFIRRALAAAQTGAEMPFAIQHRPTGRTIGSTRYLDIQPANRGLEIGWTWINPEHQRTAVNTECKFLLLCHAFERLGAIRVQFKTDARNERSRAALLRIGARFEGILRRNRILPDGFQRDSAYFSILSDEWPDVKARLEHLLHAPRGPTRPNLSAPAT